MAIQHIAVELDEETLRSLTVLGEPAQLLASFARAAADGVRSSSHPKREQTNESLHTERQNADELIARERETVVKGVAALVSGRAEGRLASDAFLAAGRDATDEDLSDERAQTDSLIVDQREANEQMVRATIRAQELTVEADAAKERAQQSERELRKVAEFREMFIGILGHDLRNPLGAIVMAGGLLLQRGNLAPQDAQTAERIVRSGKRMGRMIAQLLDLTRARLGGGMPIEPRTADLRQVCQNVVEEFGAPIQLDVEGDMIGTWDQDRVAEALSNLVGNAVAYAAAGTPVVVRVRGAPAEVVVEVTNRGEPIPADLLPFVFEPFRRALQREKSKAGNLGLGLYIAQQIVLAHRGTIDARSAEGKTTFVVRLPRAAY